MPPMDQYKWELYNIAEDYSESNDLAASNPDKLKEMQALFLKEAAAHQVLPLDNSGFVRLLAPKPSATAGVTDFTYAGVNPGIPVGNAPSILDRDYVITANITVPSGGAEGVIATLGGRFGGYALMLSPSASWFLSSKPFKYIEYGLLIFGSLLLLVGTAGRWRKRFGYVLLLVAVARTHPLFRYRPVPHRPR